MGSLISYVSTLKSVCLDVVERVCGTGVVSRTGATTLCGGEVRGIPLSAGEVRGTVTLKCPQPLLNSAVIVSFSTNIPDKPLAAG